MGIVSIGLGLVVLVLSSLPVRLMDTVRQLPFSGALTAGGFSLLIGTLLVCTACALPVSPPPIHANVKLLRGICTWEAVRYLALIPIQLYAGMRVLQQHAGEEGRTQASWSMAPFSCDCPSPSTFRPSLTSRSTSSTS